MYCRNCSNQMDDAASVCVKCGVRAGEGSRYCPHCGAETGPGAAVCTKCGTALGQPISGEQKSKLVAGLLGIFLGGFGIHNFYLGNNKRGVIQIIVTLVTCGIGAIWGFVEGIMILVGHINTDASGRPLTD